MEVGDMVKVTAGRLGGFDNIECNGRIKDWCDVDAGWVGEIVGIHPVLTGDDDEPRWYIAAFAKPEGRTAFVPVAEGHVEVIEHG